MTTRQTPEVVAFLAGLKHPLKREIQLLREIILASSPGIDESIKWNAPSFSTSEHFATFHLRTPDRVQIVLHLGAKRRGHAGLREAIADPASLLEWRGADRAIVSFRSLEEIKAKRQALTAVVRQWLVFVRGA